MAMLHDHAAPVAELHGNGDGAGRTQAIHVLAPSLPGRDVRGAAVAREHLPFLEVNVDRMVPAAAALERPDFPGAESRRRRYTAVIGREGRAAIGRDAPGPAERRDRIGRRLDRVSVELEEP